MQEKIERGSRWEIEICGRTVRLISCHADDYEAIRFYDQIIAELAKGGVTLTLGGASKAEESI